MARAWTLAAFSATAALATSARPIHLNDRTVNTASEQGTYRFTLKRKSGRMPVVSMGNATFPMHTEAAARQLKLRSALRGGAGRTLQEEVPIYGDFRELAYYYADVYVGTPGQKFTVITDTGSTLMAFPCYDCGDCGSHMDPKYDPRLSSTAGGVRCGTSDCGGGSCAGDGLCQYVQSYAEGSSLSGVFYKDAVYIGDDDNAAHGAAHAAYGLPAFKFGCHRHEGGLFTSQLADGIMGLGTGDLSIIPALWAAGKLSANVFSLCMSLNGGALALGAMDASLHTSPVQWARMSSAGFYEVSVTAFALTSYGTALASMTRSFTPVADLPHSGFNSPHTIIDSGTTFTYVPSSAYTALRNAIESFCTGGSSRCRGSRATVRGEPLCYRLEDPSHIHSFPGAAVTLAGAGGGAAVVVDIPPDHLFINMGWDGGAYCLAVYDNRNGGGVLGGNAMMGHDVVFDLESGRAGWAPSSCEARLPGAATGGGGAEAGDASVPATATPSGSASASATGTPTGSASASGTTQSTPSTDASASMTSSGSPSASVTGSVSGSATPSGTGSGSSSGSPGGTASATGSGSPSATVTAPATGTGSGSASGTSASTASPTASAEPAGSSDPTPSMTVTPTAGDGKLPGRNGTGWIDSVAASVAGAVGMDPTDSSAGAVTGATIVLVASALTLCACVARTRALNKRAGAIALAEDDDEEEDEEAGGSSARRDREMEARPVIVSSSSGGKVAAKAKAAVASAASKASSAAAKAKGAVGAGGKKGAYGKVGRYSDRPQGQAAGALGTAGDDSDFDSDGDVAAAVAGAAGSGSSAAPRTPARTPGAASAAASGGVSTGGSKREDALARAMAAVDEAAADDDDFSEEESGDGATSALDAALASAARGGKKAGRKHIVTPAGEATGSAAVAATPGS